MQSAKTTKACALPSPPLPNLSSKVEVSGICGVKIVQKKIATFTTTATTTYFKETFARDPS
jgi:hypothetical protein